MKRFALVSVVLLLLGAAVNVAIGWTAALLSFDGPLALYTPFLHWDNPPVADDRMVAWLTARGWTDGDEGLIFLMPSKTAGAELSSFCWNDDAIDGAARQDGAATQPPWCTDPARVHRLRAGWPLRSLEGSLCPADDDGPPPRYTVHTGIGYTRTTVFGDPETRVLPLRPLWLGFILNSALYAVFLGVLWFGPLALRRSVRIRRRRCPGCGYPVGTMSHCAECGSRLPSSLRAVWEAHDRQRRAADEHDGKEGHHLSMPSLSTPRSREALLEADVILAVDIKTGAESIIYGRDFLKRIRREGLSKGGAVVRVEVHPDLDDLDKLCTTVQQLRGHHEYRPPEPDQPTRPRRPKRP